MANNDPAKDIDDGFGAGPPGDPTEKCPLAAESADGVPASAPTALASPGEVEGPTGAAPKAVRDVGKVGKIPYGSTDLSKEAIALRKKRGIFKGRNVAVFEYVDESGQFKTIAEFNVRGGSHSEGVIIKKLNDLRIDRKQVKRIYSEREPCALPGRKCMNRIKRLFPQAEVSWSVDYGSTQPTEAGTRELNRLLQQLQRGEF